MAEIRVVGYSAIDAGGVLTLVGGPWNSLADRYDLNFVFTAARAVVQGLTLFAENSPDFTKLGFAKHAGYREFLKHVSVHMLTTSDRTVYVPFPSIDMGRGELQVSDETLIAGLVRKLEQAKKADFASGALSGTFVEINHYELYPEAEYAIFHMQNYEPWPGFGNAVFVGAFASMGQNWAHYVISDGEFPSEESLQSKLGIVITGSKYSAYDTSLPWIADYMSLLSRMYREFPRVKIVGICFGCQILASALGGETIKSPDYRFLYGVETVTLNAEFAQDFPSFPLSTIAISECHGDIVSRLPADATLYGSSKTAPVEVWGIPGRILCFQGHPDLCPMILVNFHVDYMRTRKNRNAIEHYEELLEEFELHPTHIDELRRFFKEFLQA